MCLSKVVVASSNFVVDRRSEKTWYSRRQKKAGRVETVFIRGIRRRRHNFKVVNN